MIEYVLLLVVSVAIILGTIYQLNSAFKGWATNYFGNYLACILETGELPSLGGGGGTGLCNQIFKPFNLADGRRLVSDWKGPNGNGNKNSEPQKGGAKMESSGARGGSYYAQGYQGSSFRPSSSRGMAKAGGNSKAGAPRSTYTGSTQVSSYGTSSIQGGNRSQTSSTTRLDTKFAFQDEKEEKQKRNTVSAKTSSVEASGRPKRVPFKSVIRKTASDAPDSSLTVSDFIRYLIIAGIIIALVLFLGGQALNIGKSMER